MKKFYFEPELEFMRFSFERTLGPIPGDDTGDTDLIGSDLESGASGLDDD